MTRNPSSWHLSDLEKIPKNGLKVFSTFACGGGSSMGYKLAGFTVVGANDIDPMMRSHYEANLHPDLFIEAPIKDLLTMDLPETLFDLDVLDGSPPCSSFSIAGTREKSWGKEKHFREGQAVQILDDLFFDFLDLANRLQPKVIVAENVKGMLAGNARGYVSAIFDRLKSIGYRPQLFLINAADTGVAQRRERVFFVAIRNDLTVSSLEINFTERWISAGEAVSDIQDLTEEEHRSTAPSKIDRRFWHFTARGKCYSEAALELEGKASHWSYYKLHDERPSNTIAATNLLRHWSECRSLTFREVKRLQSFPDDYQARSDALGQYLVGMSVPPKMMAAVAGAIRDQWLSHG